MEFPWVAWTPGTGVTVPTSFSGINMKVFNREWHGHRFGGQNCERNSETMRNCMRDRHGPTTTADITGIPGMEIVF